MASSAAVGVFRAERTASGGLDLRGIELGRDDATDLLDLLKPIVEGSRADQESRYFRVVWTHVGGLQILKRRLNPRDGWTAILDVGRWDVSDLIDCIREILS